jgi:hypothetical protein
MLKLAAAALAKDRTARRSALWRGRDDAYQAHLRWRHAFRPLATWTWQTPPSLDIHNLAG